MDRRQFAQTVSAATASVATIGQSSAAEEQTTPGRPRRIGLIGCGWYGKCDLLQLLNVEPVEVVAVCDVDRRLLAEAANLFAKRQTSGQRPSTYTDYREMLAAGGLDIVLVETPDHWHALPMIAAVENGCDVWVQKPTSVDAAESKAMLDAARRTGRTVQVNTQRRSTPHLIEAKRKFVDAGRLGNVAHAEVCCYYHMRANADPPNIDPPEHLDYPAWLGPAPSVPYNELIHPRKWRAFREFGNGIVGDMCVHMLDLVRWQLDLGWPHRVTSTGGIRVQKDSRANISDTQIATYEFDELDVVWTHRSWGDAPDAEYPWAAILYGDKGTLKLSVNSYHFVPRGGGPVESATALIETDEFPTDVKDQKRWALELHVASAIRGHWRNFLDAIDRGQRPVADIEQGHISSVSCILANNSMALGRSLDWDPETFQTPGDDEANTMLRRPYQNGYQHPADASA